MSAVKNFVEGAFHAQDDLKIYYRTYGSDLSKQLPILCLSGLTRNSKDFHSFATRMAEQGRYVVTMDYRGRGRSAYDPNFMNYTPSIYVQDVQHLVTLLDIHRCIVVGTSLGGFLAMMLAVARPSLLAGVVLNDIGPAVEPQGLLAIAQYVGVAVEPQDWAGAVQYIKGLFTKSYPDLTDEQWMDMAKAMFVEENGKIRLDYDLKLKDALSAGASAPPQDLWVIYQALTAIPTLVLRGGLSDLFGEATLARMQQEHPKMAAITVPNRGHVPLLNEPDVVLAIDQFLSGQSVGALK